MSRLAASYSRFRSAPGGAAKYRGSPNTTRTFVGRGRRRPRGQARPLPLTYTGTTAAPLMTASIPTPGFAGLSLSSCSPRVPSGKTSSAPSPSSARSAVRRAAGSAPSRRTGRAPSAWMSRPKSGILNSSAFARNASRRGHTPPTSGGSSRLAWFETTRSGPAAGTRSGWSTSSLNSRRSSTATSGFSVR